MMTGREAKRAVTAWLAAQGMPAYRLSARTIDFSDFARVSMVFVRVHDPIVPDVRWSGLRTHASMLGFRVEIGDA